MDVSIADLLRGRAHVSATPPDAKSEYSRGQAPSDLIAELLPWRRAPVDPAFSAALRAGVLAAALLGALLLVVAEFTTLFTVHTAGASEPIKSVSTGSHDSYGLIPVALLAVVLAWAATSTGNRWALVALVAVGIAALVIALVGDLPDAQAKGTIGSVQSGFKSATANPSAGLYLETLGAIVLMIAGGCGLLLGAPGIARGPRSDIKSADDLASRSTG
jgi:hypothetical protein